MTIFFRPEQGSLIAGSSTRSGLAPTTAWQRSNRRPWWAPLLRDGVRPLFLGGDLLACVVAGLLAPSRPGLAVAFALLLLPLVSGAGLYRSRLVLSLLDDLPRLLWRWLAALSLLLVITQLVIGVASGFGVAAIAGVALLAIRCVNYQVVRLLRSKGVVAHATIVVGADATGQEITQRLIDNPHYGLAPLGFLDRSTESANALPAPILGEPHDLLRLLDQYSPRAVILAGRTLPDGELVDLVRACHRHRCDVFVIPRLAEVHYVSDDVEFVWDTPLIRLHRSAYRSPAWRLKRILDVVFSSVALLILSPLMLLCAFAVYLEGGKGVIFRQERVGRDGVHFSLMKFRSLRPVNETESRTEWNISHDSRLGPVGRILRISSLDELPQLINILRGDMSLVGPRPERPHFVLEFDGLYRGYASRHRVPSGLTGWAQVHGLRGDTSIDDRARFDNFYIENWSLWLDLKILLRTAISVVKSPGS
jgi:exopolysaccharide biosynthesis polyprenyl glycosylphosphotransferase